MTLYRVGPIVAEAEQCRKGLRWVIYNENDGRVPTSGWPFYVLARTYTKDDALMIVNALGAKHI